MTLKYEHPSQKARAQCRGGRRVGSRRGGRTLAPPPPSHPIPRHRHCSISKLVRGDIHRDRFFSFLTVTSIPSGKFKLFKLHAIIITMIARARGPRPGQGFQVLVIPIIGYSIVAVIFCNILDFYGLLTFMAQNTQAIMIIAINRLGTQSRSESTIAVTGK